MAVAATLAQAQDAPYPAQSVTLIVSSAAGGTTDMAARMISDPLSKALGKPVVVDNRPGGSGAIAASVVKRAKPDGHTLLVQYSGYQVITPHLIKAAFDPIKDFAPVANILVAPQVMVVRPDLPIKTLPELVGYAKAHPGKLSYASSGNGSLQHVTGELIRQVAHVDITHVPYKGTGSRDYRPAGRQRRHDLHHRPAPDQPYQGRQTAPARRHRQCGAARGPQRADHLQHQGLREDRRQLLVRRVCAGRHPRSR